MALDTVNNLEHKFIHIQNMAYKLRMSGFDLHNQMVEVIRACEKSPEAMQKLETLVEIANKFEVNKQKFAENSQKPFSTEVWRVGHNLSKEWCSILKELGALFGVDPFKKD